MDSIRVNEALLAIGSQHTRQTRRLQNGNLPMSSKPPIYHTERSYGVVRQRWRRGQIKVVPRNISQMPKVEMTYLGHTGIAQPRGNAPECCLKVNRPRWQCGSIKIEPVKVKTEHLNDKKQQKVETTHLGRAQVAQPCRNPPKHRYGVIGLICRCGHIKIAPGNVSQTRNGRNAYLQCGNAIQPIWRPGKQIRRVSKLTIESRMMGEPCRKVNDYG